MTVTTSESLCETIRPYIPRPITLGYTELGSNIDTVAHTVTLGSNHPAATSGYCNPTVVLRGPAKVNGLGLGLPSGLKKRPFMRQSSCLPRSQGCHDLASMALPEDANSRLRTFRKQILSPIPEESPRCPSTPSHNRNRPLLKRFTLPQSSNSGLPRGRSLLPPTTHKQGSGGLFKRKLDFLF